MPDWQDVDETQLLRQAQAGNAEAFGALYERLSPAIFRFIFAHLDNRLDAEDLTEDVFFKAWRTLKNYQLQGVPFQAYLFRIARNALVDHYRRSKYSSRLASLDTDIPVRDPSPGPSELAHRTFEHQELHDILAQLREDYRLVLTLRFIGELSPVETAQVMGRTEGAVRVLQHRALAALRKLIEEV